MNKPRDIWCNIWGALIKKSLIVFDKTLIELVKVKEIWDMNSHSKNQMMLLSQTC